MPDQVATINSWSSGHSSRIALRFIILIGILSFFADFTYEGSRSIVGPYLAALQATGTVVGIVTGFGELLGYGLRLASHSQNRLIQYMISFSELTTARAELI
jgi:hypothetical protein